MEFDGISPTTVNEVQRHLGLVFRHSSPTGAEGLGQGQSSRSKDTLPQPSKFMISPLQSGDNTAGLGDAQDGSRHNDQDKISEQFNKNTSDTKQLSELLMLN